MEKRYTITFFVNENGGISAVESSNDSFSAMEVLGMLEMKKLDIARQVWGEIVPTKVKRESVKEEAAHE